MGTSHTTEALAAKLLAAAEAYRVMDVTVVREAAQVTKTTVKAGAPARLRGVGKSGAKLDVRYNLSTAGDTPAALVFASGPWPLIERDTQPHQIPRQRSSASFVGVFGHAVIPGGAEGGVHGRGGVRTRVQHPGTRGQRPWAKGVERARPVVSRMFQVQGESVLRALF